MRWRTYGTYGWGRRGWYGYAWGNGAQEAPEAPRTENVVCCPSSLRDALCSNLGKVIEVFTAAACDVVGDSERIGTVACVSDRLLELKPLDCAGERTVYYDLGHVIGFQVAKDFGHDAD